MRTLLLLVSLAAVGCSRGHLDTVGATFEPPPGFALEGESAGPPAQARFRPGLTISRYAQALPALNDDAVESWLPALRSAAGIDAGWSVVGARAGTLPVGPVVRLELRRGDERALHYVIPRSSGFVLVSLVADEARFGTLSAKLEGSLARLKLDR